MTAGMVIFHCPLEQRTCTSVYVDKYSAPSRSRLNDLAAWLRASPTGIGLTRQLQLLIGVAKLFLIFAGSTVLAMSWKDDSTLMLGNGPEPRIVRN